MFSRNDRLKELIRAELLVVMREVKDPGIAGFMTVTDLTLSQDRKTAKVFYSIMGTPEERKSTAKALERSAMYIRRLMRERLSLKMTPQFVFVYDDTPERATHIDKLLNKLKDQGNP